MVRHDEVGLALSDLTKSPIQITTWETPACFAHLEWNQDFCEFHPLSNALPGASHGKSRFACTRFNPAGASGFRGSPLSRREKRCAAQAEYGRLAAQA
jgi:hypothetical protein